jgi:hypothetical protein
MHKITPIAQLYPKPVFSLYDTYYIYLSAGGVRNFRDASSRIYGLYSGEVQYAVQYKSHVLEKTDCYFGLLLVLYNRLVVVLLRTGVLQYSVVLKIG